MCIRSDAVRGSGFLGCELRGGFDEALWRPCVCHHHHSKESVDFALELCTISRQADIHTALPRIDALHLRACGEQNIVKNRLMLHATILQHLVVWSSRASCATLALEQQEVLQLYTFAQSPAIDIHRLRAPVYTSRSFDRDGRSLACVRGIAYGRESRNDNWRFPPSSNIKPSHSACPSIACLLYGV